jgi:hypothetical protein
VFGNTYTELRLGTAPICCKRRQVFTRPWDGRVGSWWASKSQRADVVMDAAGLAANVSPATLDRNGYFMTQQ